MRVSTSIATVYTCPVPCLTTPQHKTYCLLAPSHPMKCTFRLWGAYISSSSMITFTLLLLLSLVHVIPELDFFVLPLAVARMAPKYLLSNMMFIQEKPQNWSFWIIFSNVGAGITMKTWCMYLLSFACTCGNMMHPVAVAAAKRGDFFAAAVACAIDCSWPLTSKIHRSPSPTPRPVSTNFLL